MTATDFVYDWWATQLQAHTGADFIKAVISGLLFTELCTELKIDPVGQTELRFSEGILVKGPMLGSIYFVFTSEWRSADDTADDIVFD